MVVVYETPLWLRRIAAAVSVVLSALAAIAMLAATLLGVSLLGLAVYLAVTAS